MDLNESISHSLGNVVYRRTHARTQIFIFVWHIVYILQVLVGAANMGDEVDDDVLAEGMGDELEETQVLRSPVITRGKSRMQFADGALYDGEWKEEGGVKVRDGQGRAMDGTEVFEGEWQDDKLHGEATATYASGATYDGSWVNNQMNGIGKYTWPNTAVYEGCWKSNKMHGEGTYTDPDGVAWSGEFKNGLFKNGKACVDVVG